MQRINFVELANLCVLFNVQNKTISSDLELKVLFLRNRIRGNFQSFEQLIEVGELLNLFLRNNSNISITSTGRKLGFAQKELKPVIEKNVKDYYLKNVLFKLELKSNCPASFLDKFTVDVDLKTFVFVRGKDESSSDNNWLINLSTLGLLIVSEDVAFISIEYLEITNQLLKTFRNPSTLSDEKTIDKRDEVGEYAELRAYEFEMHRLTQLGFEDLAKLVKRISIVDKSAGYDIESFSGKGKNPISKIYIEVKGTVKDKVYFEWSRNEFRTAEKYYKSYFIYSYYKILIGTSSHKGPHIIQDPIKNITKDKYLMEPRSLIVQLP